MGRRESEERRGREGWERERVKKGEGKRGGGSEQEGNETTGIYRYACVYTGTCTCTCTSTCEVWLPMSVSYHVQLAPTYTCGNTEGGLGERD